MVSILETAWAVDLVCGYTEYIAHHAAYSLVNLLTDRHMVYFDTPM